MRPSGRRALVLLAKEPTPGRVKTRLAAETSADWAAAVARACLLDLIDRLSCIDVHRVLAYSPSEARPYFDTVAGNRFSLIAQTKGDLGQRMQSVIDQQIAEGAEQTVLLGADSPTVPLPFIEEAFRRLEEVDLVLGPAMDGGYYLIGCHRNVPPVFQGVPWSTSRVLAETVARLGSTSDRLALLPPWYDVDTQSDWNMLVGHIAALRRAGVDPDVPHLEALIRAEANSPSRARSAAE